MLDEELSEYGTAVAALQNSVAFLRAQKHATGVPDEKLMERMYPLLRSLKQNCLRLARKIQQLPNALRKRFFNNLKPADESLGTESVTGGFYAELKSGKNKINMRLIVTKLRKSLSAFCSSVMLSKQNSGCLTLYTATEKETMNILDVCIFKHYEANELLYRELSDDILEKRQKKVNKLMKKIKELRFSLELDFDKDDSDKLNNIDDPKKLNNILKNVKDIEDLINTVAPNKEQQKEGKGTPEIILENGRPPRKIPETLPTNSKVMLGLIYLYHLHVDKKKSHDLTFVYTTPRNTCVLMNKLIARLKLRYPNSKKEVESLVEYIEKKHEEITNRSLTKEQTKWWWNFAGACSELKELTDKLAKAVPKDGFFNSQEYASDMAKKLSKLNKIKRFAMENIVGESTYCSTNYENTPGTKSSDPHENEPGTDAKSWEVLRQYECYLSRTRKNYSVTYDDIKKQKEICSKTLDGIKSLCETKNQLDNLQNKYKKWSVKNSMDGLLIWP